MEAAATKSTTTPEEKFVAFAKQTERPAIKSGAATVGVPKSRRLIETTIAGLKELNESRMLEREKTRAAARSQIKVIETALERLLEKDRAAKTAIGKLRRQRARVELHFDDKFLEPFYPAEESLLKQTLQRHIHVIGPPYDYGWNWGNPDFQVSNAANGWAAVRALSSTTSSAAAGIGVVLTTDKKAIVSVRPYIPFSWQYQMAVAGIGSNAHVRGGTDASVWVDGKMISPPDVRYHQAFADSISWVTNRNEFGSGVAPLDQISLDFTMVPGKVYAVNFGTFVVCEEENWIGDAISGAQVQATIPFIVVERFVGG